MADKDKPDSFRTNLDSDAVSGFKTGQKTGKAFKGKSGETRVEYRGKRQRRKKKNEHTRANDGEPFEFDEIKDTDSKEKEQVLDGKGDKKVVFSSDKDTGGIKGKGTFGKNAGRGGADIAKSAGVPAKGNTGTFNAFNNDGSVKIESENVEQGVNKVDEQSESIEYVYGSHKPVNISSSNNPDIAEANHSFNSEKTTGVKKTYIVGDGADTYNTSGTSKSTKTYTDNTPVAYPENSESNTYKSGEYSGNTSHFKSGYNRQVRSSTFKSSEGTGSNHNTQSSSGGVKSAVNEGVSDVKNSFSEAYNDTKKVVNTTDPYGATSTDSSNGTENKEQGSAGKSANNVFGGASKDIKGYKSDASNKRKSAFSTTTQSLKTAKRFTGGVGRTISAFIPAQSTTNNANNKDGGNESASGAMRAAEGAFRGVKVAVETTIKAIVAIINFIVSLVTGGFAAAFAGCLPIAIIIGIVLILIVVIITVLISVLTTLISFIAGAFFAAETVTGSDMYQYAYECAVAFQEEYEAATADADKTSLYIDGTSVTIPEDGYELEIDYTSVFFIYLAKYETATYADEYLNLTEDSAESCLDRLIEGTSENKDNFDEIFEDFCDYYTTRGGTLRLDTYTLLGYADYYEPMAYDYDLFTNNLICLWDAYEVSGEYATALGVESAETVTVTIPYIEVVETETEAESEEESAEETTEEETETEVETERETTTEAEATSEVETEAEETEEETTTSSSGHAGGGSSFTQATIG